MSEHENNGNGPLPLITPTKHPGGAPRTYNRKQILQTLIERMGCGQTLRTVLKDIGGPAEVDIYRWTSPELNPDKAEAEELRKMLTHAQELWCLSQIGLIHEIADDTSQDQQPFETTRTTKNGSVIVERGTKSDNTAVNRARLRTDVRWRAMSKLLPKIFGDKVLNEVSGPNGQPIVVNVVAKVSAHAVAPMPVQNNNVSLPQTPHAHGVIDITPNNNNVLSQPPALVGQGQAFAVQSGLEDRGPGTVMPIKMKLGND